MSIVEAAKILGLKTRQVYNLIEAGVVKARRLSEADHSPYLLDADSVERERLRRLALGKRKRYSPPADPPDSIAAEPTPDYHVSPRNDEKATPDA